VLVGFLSGVGGVDGGFALTPLRISIGMAPIIPASSFAAQLRGKRLGVGFH
jgi:uncharacterized membrane protein YfcA